MFSPLATSTKELDDVTSEVVEKTQSGQLGAKLNITLTQFDVTAPEPDPVATPKATNETGEDYFHLLNPVC